MKYFIGAKDLTGSVFIADTVDVDNFESAYDVVHGRATREKGEENFRITACNELPYGEQGASFTAGGREEPNRSREAGDLDRESKDAALPFQRSILTITDIGVDEVELGIGHVPAFPDEAAAKKSLAARFVSIAYTLVKKIIDDEITEETRVRDIYQPEAGPISQPKEHS